MEAWLVIVIVISLLLPLGALCYWRAWKNRLQVKRDHKALEVAIQSTPRRYEDFPRPVPYTIVHNHFMGGWVQVVTGSVGQESSSYDVYDVVLHSVDAIFKGTRQGWNRDYKAAQMIYGDTAAAAVARSMIHAEHNTLHRQRGVQRVTAGGLGNGAAVIALIHAGVKSHRRTFFTYVVLADGTWRFSATGKEKLKDGLSKHAVHANAARELIYAGEFHFDIDGMALVLDNNSGTFAPSKALLPELFRLFSANFPGLAIRCCDREDAFLLEAQRRIYTDEKDVAWDDTSLIEMLHATKETPLLAGSRSGNTRIGSV